MKNRTGSFFSVLARLLVGGVLVAAGYATLLAPLEDFIMTVNGYAVLPVWAVPRFAQALPWVEALIGLAVIIGLSQRFSLRVVAGLITLFWLVLGQALLRRLPITDCGCFGRMFALAPRQMWLIDGALLVLAWWLVDRHTSSPSVDEWLG